MIVALMWKVKKPLAVHRWGSRGRVDSLEVFAEAMIFLRLDKG